jgi:hypothetical protein
MKTFIKSALSATALAAAMLATPAFAAVTFDASTGTGFVGKGDVQSAFEWNNEGLQQNAGGVSFTFSASATYNVPCKNTHPRNGDIFHVFVRHTSLDAGVVSHVARDNPQGMVTGFNLTGFSGASSDNTDLSCPGTWQANGAPTLVVGSNGTSLFVHHGDDTRPLYFIAD